jgi:hypothetical protein
MVNTSYGIDIPTTSMRAGRISKPPPRLIEAVTMAQENSTKWLSLEQALEED